jgi:hypothetical protein
VSGLKPEGALLCLAPWCLAEIFQANPTVSWLVAWLGSWGILLAVWTGRVFALPTDRPLRDQLLRPWMLMQAIYAGFNFITAVFYWLNLKGITFGLAEPPLAGEADWMLAAQIQRHYVLAHAGLAIGFGLAFGVARNLNDRSITNQPEDERRLPRLLLNLAIMAVIAVLVFTRIPGLSQVAVKCRAFAVVAIAVGYGLAIQYRSSALLPLGVGVVVLAISALASGWKEEVLVLVLLIAAGFFPRAPKTVSIVTGLALVAGMVVLPAFTMSIRESRWEEGMGESKGLQAAANTVRNMSSTEFEESTWRFATERLSEASMFATFMQDVPERHPYYGLQLVKQAVASLVPRLLWRSKPNVEELVMARTREHGVVSTEARVSAKPAFVVDCYLSGGLLGVFLGGIFLGLAAQLGSSLCERVFGGYLLGGVVFNGLFAILWRGNCFEFLANSLFWSFVLVWLWKVTFGGSSARLERLGARRKREVRSGGRASPKPEPGSAL